MKLTASIFLSLIVVGSTAFSSTSLAASSYKWTDDEGNVHYSQQPPRDREAERMKIKTPKGTGKSYEAPATNVDSNEQSSSSGLPGSNEKGNTADKLSQDNAALRKKNCEAAKKNLKIYQVYRRVRDTEGNVKRLSPKERDEKIKETKDAISEFCD